MSDQEKGLYNKYIVINRETGKEAEGAYFVLQPDKDAAARPALLRYAEETAGGNEKLSADLWKWIQGIDAYAECPEDVYPLLDGGEVILAPGDRVLFQRSRPEAMPLTIDADSIIDDVLQAYKATLIQLALLKSELGEANAYKHFEAERTKEAQSYHWQLIKAQQTLARITSEFEPGKRKAIVDQCSDLNQYDDEDFSPPVCVDDLPEPDNSEVMEWLTAILRDCARNTFDTVADALGFSGEGAKES